jgi:hypothetical protein
MKILKNIKEWVFDTIVYRSMLVHINSKEINTQSLDDPKSILNIEDIEKAKDRLAIAKKKSFSTIEIASPNAIYDRKKFINNYEYILGKRELEILKIKLDTIG